MRAAIEAAKSPFEWLVAGWAVLVGLLGVLRSATAGARLAQTVPQAQLVVWFAGIASSGVVVLCGLASLLRRSMRGRLSVPGLLWERIGLWLLAGWLVAGVIALVGEVGPAAVTWNVTVTVAIAVACLARTVQITADLRRTAAQRGAGGSGSGSSLE